MQVSAAKHGHDLSQQASLRGAVVVGCKRQSLQDMHARVKAMGGVVVSDNCDQKSQEAESQPHGFQSSSKGLDQNVSPRRHEEKTEPHAVTRSQKGRAVGAGSGPPMRQAGEEASEAHGSNSREESKTTAVEHWLGAPEWLQGVGGYLRDLMGGDEFLQQDLTDVVAVDKDRSPQIGGVDGRQAVAAHRGIRGSDVRTATPSQAAKDYQTHLAAGGREEERPAPVQGPARLLARNAPLANANGLSNGGREEERSVIEQGTAGWPAVTTHGRRQDDGDSDHNTRSGDRMSSASVAGGAGEHCYKHRFPEATTAESRTWMSLDSRCMEMGGCRERGEREGGVIYTCIHVHTHKVTHV